ncbi:UDP-N-acetylmuramate--L-alanine ligase [Patescibacteria group bacterium]|nr:UDP-N-acetylmuramate--L-alanine ligase [Patescibacteria group bacterium]
MISAKSVHLIGIGGIGTSAVAKWWQDQGATVTGSDVHPSKIIDDLIKRGIQVKIGHFADNVPEDCDLIIYSRAVPATNVERQVAAKRGITELSFPEFLGELAREKKTIAVSGTNGKSTTTAMIAKIFIDAGEDPTVILGTKSPDLDEENLRIGKSEWFVVEACEHMASMLKVAPDIAVITNIEEDHLDFYRGLDHIKETFQQWADSVPEDGTVVLNARDEASQQIKASNMAKFDIHDRVAGEGKQTFMVKSQLKDLEEFEVTLGIPGQFNAMNAAAAATAARLAGIGQNRIKHALRTFQGTWRRFEHVGKWKDADVYSDYAHHPTAIQESLKSYREFFPDRRLVLVFEPHQHSRMHELFDQFVQSFDEVDVLILSEVYAVEGRTEEVLETSKDLTEKVERRKKIDTVLYAKDANQAEDHLRDVVEAKDVVIIMGAGTIDNLARKLAT